MWHDWSGFRVGGVEELQRSSSDRPVLGPARSRRAASSSLGGVAVVEVNDGYERQLVQAWSSYHNVDL